MIKSIIAGKSILSGQEVQIYDVYGKQMDTVKFYSDTLSNYEDDLLSISNSWRKTSPQKRLGFLKELKTNLEDDAFSQELVNTIHREIGKSLVEAETEVSESIGLIDYFLDNFNESYFSKQVDIDPYWETKTNYIKLQALGIVGIIKPWNYPLSNSLWSIIPAILAGNIILYKPSEHCCASANLLSKAIVDTSLPAGVFSVIFGNSIAGDKIVECKFVSMISFTGGSATAHKIQLRTAQLGYMRKFSIESGGSDFAIIDSNVDLDFAADGIVWGAFNNSGQVCTSIENVFVPDKIKGSFIKKCKKKILELVQERDYGKIQNTDLRNKVSAYLDRIKDSNKAEIICGGSIINGFLPPTLVDCRDNSLLDFEVFSNILRIISYESNDEILDIINSSIYGLGCTIWTNEPSSDRIISLIENLSVGMIWVNDVNISFPEMPWTGVKESGVGFNLTIDSLKEFSSLKAVSIDMDTTLKKEWWFPYDSI